MRKMVLMTMLCVWCAALCGQDLPFSKNWQLGKFARIERSGGKETLTINVPKDTPTVDTLYGASLDINLDAYRGKNILITVRLKGDDVAKGAQPHFCAKVLLRRTGADGMVRYYGTGRYVWGTFDWKPFLLAYSVPEAPGKYRVSVGIQGNTGRLEARDLKIEIGDLFPAPAPLPPGFRCEYSDAVRNWPRLRGAGMLCSAMNEKNLRDLAATGANLVRVWVKYNQFATDFKDIDAALDNMEKMLPLCRELGLKLIPVLTQVPGDRYRKPLVLGTFKSQDPEGISKLNFRMFDDDAWLNEYVKLWEHIAARFKNAPEVAAYDLMNEPTQSGRVKNDYLYCQYRAALAVREIDPEKPVIVSGNDWNSADGYAYLKPLPLRNVIYEIHFYHPHTFSHQGVGVEGRKQVENGYKVAYPGKIAGVFYNRGVLRNCMAPVRAFQKKYGAIIYCGEFSAIRWAPGAAQYLDDICAIAEESDWHWAYHAFREWQGWSLEHVSGDYFNKKTADVKTDRMKVLEKYWRLNRK